MKPRVVEVYGPNGVSFYSLKQTINLDLEAFLQGHKSRVDYSKEVVMKYLGLGRTSY